MDKKCALTDDVREVMPHCVEEDVFPCPKPGAPIIKRGKCISSTVTPCCLI